jgi:biotin carboxyl carrier protein
VKAVPALLGTNAHGTAVLSAPKLGVFSEPPREGALVEPGSVIGTLTQLRQRYAVVVPDGVTGRITLPGGKHDARPVGYGEALVSITASATTTIAGAKRGAKTSRPAKSALTIVAPTDGVFYRAPAVDAKPFVAVGDIVTAGRPVGLIEVMKTFNPIVYGGVGFPEEAEVVEVLATDAQEVRAGQALVVVKKP